MFNRGIPPQVPAYHDDHHPCRLLALLALICQAVGWVVGFVMGDFTYTLMGWAAGMVLSIIVSYTRRRMFFSFSVPHPSLPVEKRLI